MQRVIQELNRRRQLAFASIDDARVMLEAAQQAVKSAVAAIDENNHFLNESLEAMRQLGGEAYYPPPPPPEFRSAGPFTNSPNFEAKGGTFGTYLSKLKSVGVAIISGPRVRVADWVWKGAAR